MFRRLRNWLRERPKTLKFYLTLIPVVVLLGSLLVIALRATDFAENLALNAFTEILGAFVVMFLLENRIRKASEEMDKERESLRMLKQTLDGALQAWDRNKISRRKVIEAGQWVCWHRWIHYGDITGWRELLEEVRYGEGLTPHVRSAVEWELDKIRRKAYEEEGLLADEEEGLEQRLQDLLDPPSEE